LVSAQGNLATTLDQRIAGGGNLDAILGREGLLRRVGCLVPYRGKKRCIPGEPPGGGRRAACATEHPKAVELADKYDVSLVTVQRKLVLAQAL
jgi:hypothetical protein